MVLHLLFYFLDVCDVKRIGRTGVRVLGSDRALRDASVASERNDVENIEFRNVFPKTCLVEERKYFKKSEKPFA